MHMLDRKLLRDLFRIRVQALAIALVMACGVATLILAFGAYRSLETTRDAFYDRHRFGTVFARATRAPLELGERLAAIDGAASVELRIVKPVILDMDGMAEPGSGVAISMPDQGEAAVNRLYLRSGRLPERVDEVAVIEAFARAHRLKPGAPFRAILNGTKRELRVTGIVLSPEYIYAAGPGDIVPDPRLFGVFFMPRTVLAGISDMDGAFNDVAIRTSRGANIRQIISEVDLALRPYGGTGAHDRDQQYSHSILDTELVQLRGMAVIVPPIFLFVAAFLVNMIMTRLIALEREQIGLLKAIGYRDLEIAWHYAKLTVVIALVGIAIGAGAGNWLGRGMTRLYAEHYTFPFLIFRQSADLYLVSGGVTILAALAGSVRAISGVVRLPAAVAMQPPAPPRFRAVLPAGFGSLLPVSRLTVMAFRQMVRRPVRALATAFGMALSVALLVSALFMYDAIDFMIDTMYFRAERQDATILFNDDRGPGALQAVAALPGVMRAEPFRALPVRLMKEHREKRVSIVSAAADADLSRVLDRNLVAVAPPPSGLLLTERVAELLQARPGDSLWVEIPDRNGLMREATVTGIVRSYVGLGVYMNGEALTRLGGEGPRISGAWLKLDPARLDDLYRAVKNTPVIASISLQGLSREKLRALIAENAAIMNTIFTILALIITFGVVYNSARIQLSERARELASLRVFGFTRAEVSRVLLTELAVLVAVAQPLGWLTGAAFSWAVVEGTDSDVFRIPFVIDRSTFALSSLAVLGAAAVSALIVRRRVDRLDLVSVLKTRE